MANPNPSFSTFLFFLLLLRSAMATSEPELDAAITALRFRGYRLFGNAITASDVRYDLLSPANSSFTLFAPPDALLFSLDMAAPSAAAYVASLRLHVAPGRISFPDLRSLPDDFPLETLLPGREILVSRRRSPDADFLTVDGVDVVLPGIFYGRDIAVHGLGGILTLRRSPAPPPSISPSRSADQGLAPSVPAYPPVLEAPVENPTASPSIAPYPSLPPTPSPTPEVSPAVSPVVSPAKPPAEAAALGFSWENWACANEDTDGCTGAAAGSAWLGHGIGGWPRHQEAGADGAL